MLRPFNLAALGNGIHCGVGPAGRAVGFDSRLAGGSVIVPRYVFPASASATNHRSIDINHACTWLGT